MGKLPRAGLLLLTSPAYLLAVLGSWLVYGLVVLFAYLDWKQLKDRGVPAPFHWAWAFLSNYVYAIGRGVVVQRRTGHGRIVMWIAIAMLVLIMLAGFGIAIAAVTSVLSQIPFSELPQSGLRAT